MRKKRKHRHGRGVRPEPRHRARQVRRHITGGKIDGRALVKERGQVRIRLKIAKQQLAARLSAQSSGRALTGGARLMRASEALNLTLKSELLRGLELKTARLQEQAESPAGRYVRTADAARMPAKAVALTLDLIEGAMPGFIDGVAADLGVPQDELAEIVDEHMARVRRQVITRDGQRPVN